jgi:bacterioferritin
MTPGCKAKSDTMIYFLHEAVAAGIVCVLRYKRHYFTAAGISSESVEQCLRDKIRDDLIAQRISIDGCREMIMGAEDPANRRMLEGILASEEEHAEDLTSLLKDFARIPPPPFLQTVRAAATDRELPCLTESNNSI